jgi:LPXTG-motif cell wall-anchored protein
MPVSRPAAAGAALALSGLAVLGLSSPAYADPSPKPTKSNCPNPVGGYPPGQCGLTPASASDSTPRPGQKEHVHGEGFRGNSNVTVEAHSATVVLGTFRASAAGVLDADVTIPTGLSLGSHELVLRGVAPSGAARVLTIPIRVVKAPGAAQPASVAGVQLPTTGTEIAGMALTGLVLVGGGAAAVYSGRRRRIAA